MVATMRSLNRLAACLSAALAIAFAAAGAAAEVGRPNILWIVSEDNGPELGCYGDPYARTPRLDRLAKEGARFENAFVTYSVCSPSRASFLTGLYPHQNGQIGLATHKFAMYLPDTPNVATLLGAAGYRTGLIGKLHVNPESAFPFDFRAIPSANFQRREPITAYAKNAAKFIRESGGHPWFLSVNFPDAHLPFLKQANGRPANPLSADDVKPMPWVGVDSQRLRTQVANYYNCLERLDAGVSLLLDELDEAGQSEITLVVYIGDHGAQFPRGKGTVYEGGLRIPLIVRWPGVAKPGTTVAALASTVDLLPTSLAAAGVRDKPDLPGFDLRLWLEGSRPVKWRTHIHGFTTGAFPRGCFVQQSIRDERFKLISNPQPDTRNIESETYLDEAHLHHVISGVNAWERASAPAHVRRSWTRWSSPPRYELYDLKNDPQEWNNLFNDPHYAAERDRLVAALKNWQRDTRDPFLDRANVDAFVAEQLANRDLRYRKQKNFKWSYLDTFPKWKKEAGQR